MVWGCAGSRPQAAQDAQKYADHEREAAISKAAQEAAKGYAALIAEAQKKVDEEKALRNGNVASASHH